MVKSFSEVLKLKITEFGFFKKKSDSYLIYLT